MKCVMYSNVMYYGSFYMVAAGFYIKTKG